MGQLKFGFVIADTTSSQVMVSEQTLRDIIYHTDGDTATYVGEPRTDALTGATGRAEM